MKLQPPLLLAIGLIASCHTGREPSSAPPPPPAVEFTTYQTGPKPADLERRRQRWLAVLRDLSRYRELRVSHLRERFPKHRNVGIKSTKNLTTETWQIDDAFFIVFEIELQDFLAADPRIAAGPELHSFTYVDTLPSLQSILDRH
jgi:hypothetical protein